MHLPHASRRAQSGQAIVLIALILVALFGFVGLAVDGGRAYLDRRELQVSADSAALAMADRFVISRSMSAAMQAAASVFAANTRITTGPSANWCANPASPSPVVAPFTTCSATVTFTGDSHVLTLGYTDYRGIGKGVVFTANDSHSPPLAFMQVLGSGPNVTIAAAASTVTYDQGETPAILALGRGPCDGSSGNALTVQGGNGLSITVVGAVYSDGGIGVGNGAVVDVAGNAYQNCGSLPIPGITNPGYGAFSPVAPILTNYKGGSALPFYTNYQSNLNWPSASGAVEVQPGVYGSNPQVTGGSPCYFMDPGMYSFPGGLTVNSGLLSNELRPPDEAAYYSNSTHAGALSAGNPTSAADANYLQFWRNNGVPCDGTFAVNAVTSSAGGTHPLTPGGTWGVEVTSARQDVFYPSGNTAVSYLRESSPSMCRTFSVNGTDAGFQLAISNAPGAQWYNVYISPSGCAGATPFGYAASVCSGQSAVAGCSASIAMTNNKQNCPNLPAWSGTTPLTAGPNQNSSTCTLGYTVSQVFDSANLAGFSSTGAACAVTPSPASATALGCAAPDSELCPAGIAGCITGAPNAVAGRNLPNTGDRADENECADGAGNLTQCPGSITPGGVQLVFDNTSSSCLSEGGGGGVWVFGGKQYDFIVIYSTNSTCKGNNANKIVGGSATTYVGAMYFPNGSLTMSGGGQTTIAQQVIAYNITLDGSSGVTVDFNPDYAPSPPAGRLIT